MVWFAPPKEEQWPLALSLSLQVTEDSFGYMFKLTSVTQILSWAN